MNRRTGLTGILTANNAGLRVRATGRAFNGVAGLRARGWWWEYLSFPAFLWVALWFSINTGPSVLSRGPASLIQWLHAIRAFFPHAVLPIGLCYLAVSNGRSALSTLPGPLKLWLLYGLVGLVSSLLSPSPLDAAYWAVAYLAAVAGIAAFLKNGDPLKTAARANYLSWFVNTAFLLTMVILAREALFANPHSGYGVMGRQPRVLDMPMSRSTGLARFAAVPGIAALGFALCRRGVPRIVGGLIFAASCAAFIYYLQARGSIVGFAGAVIVVLVLTGVRGKLLLAGVALTLVGAWLAQTIPSGLWEHLTRGETTWEQLKDLTGRVSTWQEGWQLFLSSPAIGLGPRADRIFGLGEIHNTWMSALLQSGIIGAAALFTGLAMAWREVVRLAKAGVAQKWGQQETLAQVGGILAFYTLRGLVEQCGSLFNVDLMVMLPAIAYIGVLAAIRASGSAITLIARRQQ